MPYHPQQLDRSPIGEGKLYVLDSTIVGESYGLADESAFEDLMEYLVLPRTEGMNF